MSKLRAIYLYWVLLVMLTACGDQNSQNQVAPLSKVAVSGPPAAAQATVTFTGKRSAYAVFRTSAGYVVQERADAQSMTTIPASAQALQFSDMSMNLLMPEKAKSISPDNLKSLIELYIAFFNRVPDANGLAYWIDRFKEGMTINQIADNFYLAAIQFSAQTGYSSSMSNADFVKIIYRNVLGRSGDKAPPDADVQYWANELASGRLSKGALVNAMLFSAHTFINDPTWGWVPTLLGNKIAAGQYFAVDLSLNYNSDQESIAQTMLIAAAVTPQSVQAAKDLLPINNAPISATNTMDIPRVSRTVVLMVAPDVLQTDKADIDALALAIANEHHVSTQIMSAPAKPVEIRTALQAVVDLWGVMLIGEVAAPKNFNKLLNISFPDDNAYRNPFCPAYQIAADGSTVTSDSTIYLGATQCRNGAWSARIKGRTAQSQLADVTGYIKKNLRLRSSFHQWNAQYQRIRAAWHSGIDFENFSAYWASRNLYLNSQLGFLKTGSGKERKDAFVKCITNSNEFCWLDAHGSPDGIVFEGPGVVGQTYSQDAVPLTASELAQLPKRAKVLMLESCSTGDFIGAKNPSGYFAGNALFDGDTLLVVGTPVNTFFSDSFEQEQVTKRYHVLAHGASFVDADTQEVSPLHYFGDPTIALRPKSGGPQPKLVIDNQRYHGTSIALEKEFPESVGGATRETQINLRNEGNATLKIQLTHMPEFVGINNALPGYPNEVFGSFSGFGFALESPEVMTESGSTNLGNVILTVEPGQTLQLRYSFAPKRKWINRKEGPALYGNYTGRMEIHSNDPELARIFLEFKGVAKAQ